MKVDHDAAEIILNGVHSTYQGQGVFTGVLNYILYVG